MAALVTGLGWTWLGAAAVMLALWGIQRRTGNAGIVDAGWSALLGGAAVFLAAAGDGDPLRRVLLALLGGLWGGRLALHLLRDRVIGREEEGRYVALRRRWGAGADAKFLVFFQAQALSVALLAPPFALAAADRSAVPSMFDVAATLLWLCGWVGENAADRQLRAWKSDPANRGRTCRRGLWGVSRHPNYFFEWVQWCSFALLGTGAPGGALAWLSPAIILVLVLFVTGIPPTEAQALRTRGDDYRRYQAAVSPFVPWFPRTGPARPGRETTS